MKRPCHLEIFSVYAKISNALTDDGDKPESSPVDLGGFDRYVFDYIGDFDGFANRCISLILNGRCERI